VFLHAVAQDVIGHAHLPQASLFISRTLCAQSGEGSAGETHSQDPAEKMRAAHQPGRGAQHSWPCRAQHRAGRISPCRSAIGQVYAELPGKGA
jgi:hypothetical protein